MKKLGIFLLIGVTILTLALTDPFGPQRDPVPATVIVAHSSHCSGCHGHDETGVALVDGDGNDVSLYTDATVSMMGMSSKDPFWRATLKHETDVYPSAKAEIEATCLKCHAPLGSHQKEYEGLPYSYEEMLQDSLGLDGVSCSACHQQPPETFGTSHSGNIVLNTDRVLYGPYPLPFEGPMELYVGFRPEYTDLMNSSGVCAGCHTLITETLNDDGTPSGHSFVEQATYHEWLNSTYAFQGRECQSCHMPVIEDSVAIATGQKGLAKRHPYALHQFQGANTAMLTLMQENKKALGLPDTIPDAAWDESIANNRASLRRAAEVSILSASVFADTLLLEIRVTNKAGHKLPSGYPSRIAWLQIILTDQITGDTLYVNGMMDAEGNLNGRDFPYEPHHEIIRSPEDVQIYELAMADVHGGLTTRLNAAYEPFKDNRLLPAGFRKTHPVYDTVAIWGEALADADYDVFSIQGGDLIEYRIPLHGKKGVAYLRAALLYHTFPSRWMQDIFSNDEIPEVSAFKEMYSGYENFTELIDDDEILELDLGPSAVSDTENRRFALSPNPVTGDFINVAAHLAGKTFTLTDVNGQILRQGLCNEKLEVSSLPPGVYFFIVRKEAYRFVRL